MEKDADAYRTISEVAQQLGLPSHVLRFWETKFPQIKPLKRGGGRRYYRPQDADLLRSIRRLLHDDGYTIRGVQRLIRDQGPSAIMALAHSGPNGRHENGAVLEEIPMEAYVETPADSGEERSETMERPQLEMLRSLLDELEKCRTLLAGAFKPPRHSAACDDNLDQRRGSPTAMVGVAGFEPTTPSPPD